MISSFLCDFSCLSESVAVKNISNSTQVDLAAFTHYVVHGF
jgi:hypothetical protein